MYAPVIVHFGPSGPFGIVESTESHFPANVDWFLAKASLAYYDDGCLPDLYKTIATAPPQAALLGQTYTGGCGSQGSVRSDGTRSAKKHRTFYLGDVGDAYKGGSLDSRDWTTYFHAYPNYVGGVTIQYWRLYPYHDTALADHGGDWQAVYVVLGPGASTCQNDCVTAVGLLDDESIDWVTPPWTGKIHLASEVKTIQVPSAGTHFLVFSEAGGHIGRAALPGPWHGARFVVNADISSVLYFTVQETWPNGIVHWSCDIRGSACRGVTFYNAQVHKNESGRLLDVGEKSMPMNGQVFIQYSASGAVPGRSTPRRATGGRRSRHRCARTG